MHQAAQYQVEFGRYKPEEEPSIETYLFGILILIFFRLLKDYSCMVVPNTLKDTFVGHTDNVKCVNFIGEEGECIVSGSRYSLEALDVIF